MKFTQTLSLLLLAAAAITPFTLAQKREKDKAPRSFTEMVNAAGRNWEATNYGRCVEDLKQALNLAVEKRSEKIVESLPAAPEGYEKEPIKKDTKQNNALASAMLGGLAGTMTTQRYKEIEGRANINVQVAANSPMVATLGMMFGNPMMRGENTELIEYDGAKALLKTNGKNLDLQILIAEKHYCQVTCNGLNDDQLIAMFNQAAVTKISNALSR